MTQTISNEIVKKSLSKFISIKFPERNYGTIFDERQKNNKDGKISKKLTVVARVLTPSAAGKVWQPSC